MLNSLLSVETRAWRRLASRSSLYGGIGGHCGSACQVSLWFVCYKLVSSVVQMTMWDEESPFSRDPPSCWKMAVKKRAIKTIFFK